MKKNILILAHSYGMQFLESCNQYAQLFDSAQYEVTIAYLVGEPDEKIKHKTRAENILFLNCSRKEIRGLKLSAIRRLLTLCRQKQFDCVICHRYKPTYLMLWVAQFCRIPTLFFVMHALGTMKSLSRRLLIATLFRKNMIFAGVSDAVRDDLRRNLWRVPAERIQTLYNLIDHSSFEPQLLTQEKAREQLHLAKDAFVFGHIGRFTQDKDQKTLIQAFAMMKPHCPHAKLVMIGDGKLELELKNEVALHQLENDVIFTGFIVDGFQLMKAFDIFVLTSIKEGFGRVLLEAMMAKLPIIATRIGGIPEVLGDTNFLIEAKQTQVLAETLQKTCQSTKTSLQAIGEQGYQRMLNKFSCEAFKKTFWQVFNLRESL